MVSWNCTSAVARPRGMSAGELITAVAAISAREELDLEELDRTLHTFVHHTRVPEPETWSETTGRYIRVLLNSPDDPFQIIVVFWPPGARSAIHDHADSSGAVVALFGELIERKYQVEPGVGSTCALARAGEITLAPGRPSAITTEPGMQLHEMVNASHAWAATVHVYLRPIEHFHVYRAAPTGGFVREHRSLWFDYDHGAARWDRPVALARERGRGELGRIGGCACGALRLEIAARPTLELSCYCSDCRRSTGSFMAPLAFYPGEALQIHGEVKLFERRNDSGYLVRKAFCPCCGTTVTHASESYPHLIGVPVGVLDDATHFRPSTNIYVGSAPPWARLTPTFAHRG
jgi:predicted metal-dependent enzyme (double-stranded beta helix superfamily)